MKIIIHTKGTIKSMAAVRLSTSRPTSRTDVPIGSQGIDTCQVSSHTPAPDRMVTNATPQEITVAMAIPPIARLELRRLFGLVKRIMAANTSRGMTIVRGTRVKMNSICYLDSGTPVFSNQ